MRRENGYASSNVNLKLYKHEYTTVIKNGDEEGEALQAEVDYFFDNALSNPSKNKRNGDDLDRGEKNRQRAIKDLQVECWLLINGTRVKNTGKYPVNWPDCTAEIFEQF